MSEQSQILYVEKEIGILNPEIKLLTRTKFIIHKATTIEEAKSVLNNADIDTILIDICMTSDPEWGSHCITFIQEPDYSNISKVIIDIDPSALGAQHRVLENNSSIIHFHYKADPNRYEKLMMVLQERHL